MIRPNRPMALPKISTMRILTKSAGLAASDRAAPEPTWPTPVYSSHYSVQQTWPTQRPHTRLTRPVVTPAPNMA